MLNLRHGPSAGQRFDAPHPGGHTGLGDDLEQTDVAGTRRMGAAAQLPAEGVQIDHPHAVAVFLLEKGRGTGLHGLVHIHLGHVDGHVFPNTRVDEILDAFQGLGTDRGEMGKIEA